MKILFVWSAAEWSTFDVAYGYRQALERAGAEVRDYRLYNHIKHHALALQGRVDMNTPEGSAALSQVATEAVIIDVLKYQPDVVLICSGLSFHPNALWMIRQLQALGFPTTTAVLHTESPYEDADQAEFSKLVDISFTNDRGSAERHGWHYLAHAVDPEVHRPVTPLWRLCAEALAGADDAPAPGPAPWSDVLICGTGWPERQRLLEQVDWTGIKLTLLGLWPGVEEGSPLFPYYQPCLVRNERLPHLYASSRICLNFHRQHPEAQSLNPRARELAACGAFQISDYRPELDEVLRSVPTFREARELELLVRSYLANPEALEDLRQRQRRELLEGAHTFDDRAHEMLTALAAKVRSSRRVPAPSI